ncbi:uncharacterized protein LOC103495667 [Cucumis melo]|uniref:Uncharacterized protein LOC103495667 n=3 Tax=Cucumis melo TaxID=3656 RepID=A0A1S3C134_CUCME|nr:uncharacterized protein LOC103495667 [Cucumis melo]
MINTHQLHNLQKSLLIKLSSPKIVFFCITTILKNKKITKPMWRLAAAVRRNLHNIRKSPRVADESMYGGGVDGGGRVAAVVVDGDRREGNSYGFSMIYSLLRTPFSILSCFSQPHVNGVDGMWVSGEFPRISEVNHLMVSDSMRYAILM